ncbi:MAG: MBL fold metallo-hydrolase [Clostridiales bacterium]|nr:MBL fold metallo-hydrolase [Clostridiales bacterium]
MYITALMENTSGNECCATEHGLSLYVETKRHRILFDTGQSGLFAENAKALGIDLEAVDLAVLSHGHYDHSGGLEEFLRINRKAKVYLNRGAFVPHYNKVGKYIGVAPDLKGNPRIVETGDSLDLGDGIRLVTYNQRPCFCPVESYGMTEETEGVRKPDAFRHEQYLIVTEGDQKVLLSGCSHKGIYNVVQWAAEEKVDVVIGGFHFMTLQPEEYGRMDRTAEKLLEYPAVYYTCHCTGVPQYEYLKGKMGDALHYLAAGQTLDL